MPVKPLMALESPSFAQHSCMQCLGARSLSMAEHDHIGASFHDRADMLEVADSIGVSPGLGCLDYLVS